MDFTGHEIDLLHEMFESLWDEWRHNPEEYGDCDLEVGDSLFNKLRKLGAV